MSEQVRIQVLFSEETKHGNYTDALYFTLEEYQNLDKKDLELMKKDRIKNYEKIVADAAKKTPPEPKIEELQATAEGLKQQLENINEKIKKIDPDTVVETNTVASQDEPPVVEEVVEKKDNKKQVEISEEAPQKKDETKEPKKVKEEISATDEESSADSSSSTSDSLITEPIPDQSVTSTTIPEQEKVEIIDEKSAETDELQNSAN
jgi:hypothetical protein